MLHDWAIRLRALFKRTTVEHELEHELLFHIEQQIDTYVKAGLGYDEAVRRTRLEFGGLDQIKEECRDARGIQIVDNLRQDVRYATRNLRKNPGFAAVAVFTPGLGLRPARYFSVP